MKKKMKKKSKKRQNPHFYTTLVDVSQPRIEVVP